MWSCAGLVDRCFPAAKHWRRSTTRSRPWWAGPVRHLACGTRGHAAETTSTRQSTAAADAWPHCAQPTGKSPGVAVVFVIVATVLCKISCTSIGWVSFLWPVYTTLQASQAVGEKWATRRSVSLLLSSRHITTYREKYLALSVHVIRPGKRSWELFKSLLAKCHVLSTMPGYLSQPALSLSVVFYHF